MSNLLDFLPEQRANNQALTLLLKLTWLSIPSKRPSQHEQAFSTEEINEFELGEHANEILQALCRGAVRKSQDDTCPKCDAYVIASVRSGIPKDIRRIFPDCVTKKWDPLPQKLNGRAAEAFKLVKEWADAAESGDTYSFRHLMKEMGVDRRNFKKDIREHEGFKSAIASIGGFEWAANKHYTAFCKN